MDPRTLTAVIATIRMVIGAALTLLPGRVARGWLGREVSSPATQAAVRGLGVRDVAIGAGTLLAMSHDRGVRGWVEAGSLADLGDAAATLLSWDDLPPRGRVATLAMAGGAAVTGIVLARTYSREDVEIDADEQAPAWRPHTPGTQHA